jgi:hypothetical protein
MQRHRIKTLYLVQNMQIVKGPHYCFFFLVSSPLPPAAAAAAATSSLLQNISFNTLTSDLIAHDLVVVTTVIWRPSTVPFMKTA